MTIISEQTDSGTPKCIDTDIDFFSENKKEIQRAVNLCNECPVRELCLQYSLKNHDVYGVWGGLTAKELRNLQKLGDNLERISIKKGTLSCPICGEGSNKYIYSYDKEKRSSYVSCALCGLDWYMHYSISTKQNGF